MTALLYSKRPARQYPNMQAVHAIRAHYKPAAGPGSAPIVPMTLNKQVHIGTIPAGAMILASQLQVISAFTPTGYKLSVGTPSNPTLFANVVSLDAAGITPGTTGLGYVPDETPVVATLSGGLGSPATGEADVLLTFYWNKD